MLKNYRLEAHLVRKPKSNGESPVEDAPAIQIDPEQIAKQVQETILYAAFSVGAIVIAKKVLDIVGDVTVAVINAKAK